MKVTDVKETVFNWEQEAWNTGIGGGTGANKNALVNDVKVDDTGLVYARLSRDSATKSTGTSSSATS